MALQVDASNVINTLAAIPMVDTARIIRGKGEKLLIELQYSVKDYWGREASKYQYEQTAMLDTATSTAEFSTLGSPLDLEVRRFKSISPSGSYALIGVRKKTTEEEPSNYLHVRQ